MKRIELIKNAVEYLREKNLKKPVRLQSQVFHISDNNGNSKDFVVKTKDTKAVYTIDDVSNILDAFLAVAKESIKRGEEIRISGFGRLGLKYRRPIVARNPKTEERISLNERYVIGFYPSEELKICAKLYSLSLSEYHTPESEEIEDVEFDSEEKGE